ncbi:MAG: hypothetical protein BWX64_02791 [Acidobacteria bacterium ADurb.Bin051]|nr:MAG: hypothetical protein BWX64_02791 [Acidobacteria bacterium ADurb.Bin051]
MNVPTPSPCESNVTVTGLVELPAVVPLAGLTESHGTSAGEAQFVSGSSATLQVRSGVPAFVTVSVCVVVTSGACVLASAAGLT